MMDSIDAEGQTYDLSHLKAFDRQVQLSLRGGFQKEVLITFKFSSHCYTRTATEQEVSASSGLLQDGSKHQPRYRVFDPQRHRLSLQLVPLIDQLIQEQGRVYLGSHHNVLKTQVVEGDGVLPYVFFMKIAKKTDPKRLEVYVESAYAYDAASPPFPLNRPQSFMKKLSEAWG
jgi:hypothetical protein